MLRLSAPSYLRRSLLIRTASAAALLSLLDTSSAIAGGTKQHRVSDFDEFDSGEVDGAAIESRGRVTAGIRTTRTPLEKGRVAMSCAADGKQALVGTADEATLLRVKSGKKGALNIEEIASFEDHVAVSAILPLGGGKSLVALLPGNEILKIDAKGKATPFATLEGVKQIWGLAKHKDRILVATGPKGELWSVPAKGTKEGAKPGEAGAPERVLDVGEEHIMSILIEGQQVLVGTAGKSRIYELTDDPKGRLIHEFKGADEVRAMTLHQGTLYAISNDFEDRGLGSLKSMREAAQKTAMGSEPSSSERAELPEVKAKAKLWAVEIGAGEPLSRAAEAPWESLLSKSKQFFSDLGVGPDGELLVLGAQEGKVYRVRANKEVATVADLDERRAATLCSINGGLNMIGTGDGGALLMLGDRQAQRGVYLSEVFDAKLPANYGRLALRGSGKLEVRTRTGPSEEPDERWSAWRGLSLQEVQGQREGKIPSPMHRYFQLEVALIGENAELREFEVFYAPENLAPRMASVSVKAPEADLDEEEEADPEAKISWKAEAVDSDKLVYEVGLREEGSDRAWMDLTPKGPTSKKELELDLSTIPDGTYEVAVTVSDEPSNGSARAQSDRLVSEPFTVDRERPEILSFEVEGDRVKGEARDGRSRIHDVALSVDDGPFRPLSPADGIFDSRQENFEGRLPKLDAGRHRVVLRVRDASGNIQSAARTARTGP